MISVYSMNNIQYTKNGDAVLQPISATVKIVAGGQYDLVMEHPIDPHGKWALLVPESIIKAPIPEELIENAFAGLEADVYKTTVAGAALREGPSEPQQITYGSWSSGTSYAVGAKVTSAGHNYQLNSELTGNEIYQNPASSGKWSRIADMTSGSPVLIKLKLSSELYYVSGPEGGWYKMSTMYGLEGYIKSNQVDYDRHLTPSETKDRIVREQLFRIKKVVVDTKQMRVSVTATHVSYDLNGVLMENIKIVRKPPAQSIAIIENAFMIDYPGSIASNIIEAEDRTFSAELSGKNGMYAIMDPDKGVVAQFEAAFRRDNWDLFVMEKTNTDSGLQIRYANNMIGVSWTVSSDNLVTRVIPVAKDEEGNDFYLGDDVEDYWVDSTIISHYPRIRMERIKVDGQVGKDDGTETATNWTETTLRAEMLKQAQARFDVDKCDQLKHEITIDFVRLGDTDEYKQYKVLQNLRLYDKVLAVDPRIDLSVKVEIVEIEFDAVNERVLAMKLSNVEAYNVKNVAGFNVLNNSITSDKLTDEVLDGIADYAVDEANAFTQSAVSGMSVSLKAWAQANFQPIGGGE